jgi:hypothetical protein
MSPSSHGETSAAVSAIHAVKHAFLMYRMLTQIVSGPETDGAQSITQSSASTSAGAAATPLHAATATPPPTGASAGTAPAAVGGLDGSQQPHDCVVRVSEMLPPDFHRHCAAVAAWGPNIVTLTELVQAAVATLHAPVMLGAADKLLSWEAGKGALDALDSRMKHACVCNGFTHVPWHVYKLGLVP